MNKFLITGCIIVVLTTGFYFFTKSTSHNNQSTSPQPTQATSPQGVTKAFFDSYLSCMKQPPEEAFGHVSEYCQTHTGYTTDDFAHNLEMGGVVNAGADPITCSQAPPETVTFKNETVNTNTATSTVSAKFGERAIEITADLENKNGEWFITNIICPPIM